MIASMISLRWPGRPRALPDETLSSWFQRLADANGLMPSELYHAVLPGGYLHSQDLDRTACIDLMRELAARTGVEPRDLSGMTLARWRGRVYDEDDGRSRLAWVPPVGTDKTRRCFGQQYCPHCLASDPVPYFRMEWRLQFVTACSQHKCLLADRCPSCSEPIYPVKAIRRGCTILCHKCGTDLTRAMTPPAEEADIARQSGMLRVAEEGWAELDGYGSLYGLAYFQLLQVLFRLVAGGPLARALRNQFAVDERERIEVAQIRVVKDGLLVNSEQRHLLLRLVGRMLDSWPHSFIRAARAIKAFQSDLIKDSGKVPFAFWEPIVRELSATARTVAAAEILEGKGYLQRHGRVPTYGALSELFGNCLAAQKHLAEPHGPAQARGTGRFWRLEGIDPALREAVIKAAHRDGENLAGWVEKALRVRLHGAKSVFPSIQVITKHNGGDHASPSYPEEL